MFRWELTHFLESIESPFVTFDGVGRETTDEKEIFTPIAFNYAGHNSQLDTVDTNGAASEMSFPFPISDLYLNRPLVLKCHIQSPSQLRQLVLNGSYLDLSGKTKENSSNLLIGEMRVEHCNVLCNGNQVKDNHSFPMEMILANEEINYWHGDYWYKQNNWVFRDYGSQLNVPKEPNPFALFGTVEKEQVKKIIGDLSDQTGIVSKFRAIVSFRMTAETFDELSKNINDSIEQSRNDDMYALSQSEIELTKNLMKKNGTGIHMNEYQPMSDVSSVQPVKLQNHDNYKHNESNLLNLRARMHRRGIEKKNKNKMAAAAVIATLGILGNTAVFNPVDNNDDNTFFLEFGYDSDNDCTNCADCQDCADCCEKCCSGIFGCCNEIKICIQVGDSAADDIQ